MSAQSSKAADRVDPTIAKDLRASLSRQGYALVENIFLFDEVKRLREIIDGLHGGHKHSGRLYAARHLLRVPQIAELARSIAVRTLVVAVLGKRARAVRGLLFNKVVDANWAVPWHQDLTIAVHGRRRMAGYGPWSVKDGVVHVQPPDKVMAGMLAARIHLDDADAANGALRVIPGSHAEGRLSAEAIGRWTTSRDAVTITAPSGSVLLMRPHLLHSSSTAQLPAQRRVIHLEYAAGPLADGLAWAEEVGLGK